MRIKPNFATTKAVLISLLFVLTICCLAVTFVLTTELQVASADTPMPIAAEVTVDSEEAISKAFSEATSGSVIKLTKNIALSSGLIYNKAFAVTLNLNNFTLTGVATVNVITINNSSATLYLTDDSTYGSGTITGGAHGVNITSGKLVMTGGNISGNSSTNGGGVYINGGSSFTMSGGAILGNAASYGAGVYVGINGTFTMSDSAVISYNKATNGGAGVYVTGDNGTFIMKGGIISHNQVTSDSISGGGVYVTADASFTMEGGTISNNVATRDGGGVTLERAKLFTMTGGTISHNLAGNVGGAIHSNSGNRSENNTLVTINNGTISDNDSETGGGGIYVGSGTSLIVNNSSIIRNTTGSYGGGIATSGSGFLTIADSTISDNTAGQIGGGVRFSSVEMNISGLTVIKDNILSQNNTKNNLEVLGHVIKIAAELKLGADIGITNSSSSNAFTFVDNSSYINSITAKYFHADNENQCIGLYGNSLVLGAHKMLWQTDEDSAQHWLQCANCGEQTAKQDHTVTTWSNATENHTGTCDVCNKTVPAQNHTLGEWQVDVQGKHYQKCTATGCTYETEHQSHELEFGTYVSPTEHKGYCKTCKTETTENHTPTGEFTSEDNHDLNGHWQTCSVCNSRVNEATHEWGSDWKDAGDYHLQTCETCTQEYRQDHTFSSWTTAGDTNHTRKCNDCQREETLAHVVGEVFYNDGEGNHYKKCQDCDAEIERQSHNYNGKYYDDGKGNHYQICEECNYTTEYTPHNVTSWSSNGSETHQGQCETCQLTVVASHDWAGTKTFDGYGHWYKCNAQDCAAKNDYREHVVSTWIDFKDEVNHKGNCTDCDKQDITAPHTLGKLQQDEDGYYQECTVCKYKVEYSDVGENHEHDYSELCYDQVSHWYKCECGALQNVKPHDNSEWKFEGKNHYKYCETCKQKYLDDEHSLIKHTGYEETCNATGLKDYWECRICNSYFSDEGVTRITMDINTWLEREEQSGGGIIPSNSAKHQYDQVNFKSNETGHWYECTVCGEKLGSIANHVDVDDWTDNGDGRHYKTCQYCNYVTKYESHNGANWHTDGNQTHTGTCLDCGATVTQSHDWNNTFTYDEYTHWYACKATGCTERKAETAHVGNNWQNVGNSTYHEGICDCGYAHVKQSHTLTWETYQDSYRQECKICGYADDSSVTDHVFTNWEYLNEDEHQSHCDIPNHEDVQTAAHVWETKYDQTSHWQVCKDCGYEKNNSRTTHVLTSGTQNQDETHTGTCTVCGAEGIRQDHVWSEDWVVGEDSHWRECTICGAHIDESAHNVTEFTTDGEHTHSGECAICGKHFEREHTWLFGFCTQCPDQLKNYSEADIGIAATAIVAQLFALIAIAAIISRRIKR